MMVCLSNRKALDSHSAEEEVLQTLLIAFRLNMLKDYRNDLMQWFFTFLTPLSTTIFKAPPSPKLILIYVHSKII